MVKVDTTAVSHVDGTCENSTPLCAVPFSQMTLSGREVAADDPQEAAAYKVSPSKT